MPVSLEDAKASLKAALPGALIEEPILYRGVWLFQVYQGDPEESAYDPFISVNRTDGTIRDFNVITDGSVAEIAELYATQRGITNGS